MVKRTYKKPRTTGTDDEADQSRGPVTSLEQFKEALEDHGREPRVTRAGKGTARCPAHDDHDPSLDFQAGDDVPVVATCRSRGCTYAEILAALGFSSPQRTDYEYVDADGDLSYVVRRGPDKSFRAFHPKRGRLVFGLGDREKILYRLPDVVEAVEADRVVYVVEGERDADSVSAEGVCATTSPFGAGKWESSYSETLRGADVIVVADRDPAGYRHAAEVVSSLDGVAHSVRVVEAAEGKDATDHLEAGYGLDEFVELSSEALIVPPVELPEGYRVWCESDDDRPRPELHDDARLGLAGDIAALLEDGSEIDGAAAIAQLLPVVGAMVGRTNFFPLGADRHYPNLFVGILGPTGTGRKGMAMNGVLRVIGLADPEFFTERITGGLGSGEGLIQFVRDEDIVEGEAVPRSADDQRAVVKAAELSHVFKITRRENSILSEVMREAWDGGTLHNTVKGSPLRSTESCVSFLGHMTPHEARERIHETGIANGFANRYLWVYSERRQEVALPEPIPDKVLQDLAGDLAALVESARAEGGAWDLSREATRRWVEEWYSEVSNPPPGLRGELLARGPAIVLRMAMVYAILDDKADLGVIGERHLRAALALYRYGVSTVEHVWGDAQGDADADRLLKAVREAGSDGLSFTGQSKLFGGHREKKRLHQVRRQLEDRKLIATGQVANGSVSVAISPTGAPA